MHRLLFVISLCLLVLSGCAQTGQPTVKTAEMGNLLLAEPAPINPRSEIMIARYNQILSLAELKDEERAELLYQRGILYDSVGLTGLAKFDYGQALELKPDMAAAYNSIGVHYVRDNQFIEAYDAFDATLDIDPNYDFALLNRGIALYYGGRPDLAVPDLTSFVSKDGTDPFRILWAYFALYDVEPEQARSYLAQKRVSIDDRHWAASLIDMFLGQKAERDVLTNLINGIETQKQLTDRLCEAYFYLGKYHQMKGRKGSASNYFKLSLSTNVYDYVEHRYARIELNRLRGQARQQTK